MELLQLGNCDIYLYIQLKHPCMGQREVLLLQYVFNYCSARQQEHLVKHFKLFTESIKHTDYCFKVANIFNQFNN